MKDRFKFRFFNKTLNRMVYAANNHAPQDLMQCTGLKDKNGKLIYEGDIVKLGNGSINGSVMELIYEVEWNINGFNIPSWIINTHDLSHYIEVIGNIYENEELLGGADD